MTTEERLWISRFATSKRISDVQFREMRVAGAKRLRQTGSRGMWRVRGLYTARQLAEFFVRELKRDTVAVP